jgi:hypothetical protein
MSRQASVQLRHAPAQTWQCDASCGVHSRAQASHINAHKVHRALANSPSRANMAAHNRQTAPQSVHSAMQRFIAAGFPSRQADAQMSQATAHS